jgi:hypothetical protein
LTAPTDLQLYIVDSRTERHIAQRKRVARLDIGFARRKHGISNREANRPQNVAFFTVYIVQKSNARTAVWIVFNAGYFCRHAQLVSAEINHAETAFMSTTAETRGDPTKMVPTTC